jgi:hypothetical protein
MIIFEDAKSVPIKHSFVHEKNLKNNCKTLSCWTPMAHTYNLQEAEIRRIMVQSQPRKMVHESLSFKNPSHKMTPKQKQKDTFQT